MRTIYISASQAHDWQDCERKWLMGRLYEPLTTDWTLIFGRIIHEAINLYLLGVFYGFKTNPDRAFRRAFDNHLKSANVNWGKKYNPREAHRMGRRMLGEFIDEWKAGQFEVVARHGRPMLEVKHQRHLGRGVILTGFVDCIAWSPKYGLVIFDFKTAATFSQPWFASVAPQLSVYILLFEDYLQRRVDRVGFFEMKKNKLKRTPAHINVVPRHSQAQLDHTVEQIHWMVDDIRRGRFPARVRMAWNSPCTNCDFQAVCHQGHESAYRKKRSLDDLLKAA
jgi:hypothetical protein